jgi:hypothetical protein
MPFKDPAARREYNKLYQRGWRAEHKDSHHASVIKWQKANAERTKEYNKTSRRRRVASGKHKAYIYGITAEELYKMLESQEGKCAICRRQIQFGGHSRNSACVDHDHKCCPRVGAGIAHTCGKCNRSLLCLLCNTAVGMLLEDHQIAQRAVEYLRRWSKG